MNILYDNLIKTQKEKCRIAGILVWRRVQKGNLAGKYSPWWNRGRLAVCTYLRLGSGHSIWEGSVDKTVC